ncbi:MAG: type II toxin-antitoxin system VapC family toxin [Gaiellaceae bacterium]
MLDASAVLRALVYQREEAGAWLATHVAWPAFIYLEAAHTMLRLHRNRLLSLDEATRALDTLMVLPADVTPTEMLVRAAWSVALARNLSVYDACYVVLAEALGAPLVTADRRLAEATPNAVLLT